MTGQFLDPLIVQAYAKGTIDTAPKYFITDLASTPWLVKPVLKGIEDRACVVIHDWLYCQSKLTREKCDALFYKMLLATGADQRRAQAMFSGLRIGGWYRYSQRAGGVKVEHVALN